MEYEGPSNLMIGGKKLEIPNKAGGRGRFLALGNFFMAKGFLEPWSTGGFLVLQEKTQGMIHISDVDYRILFTHN